MDPRDAALQSFRAALAALDTRRLTRNLAQDLGVGPVRLLAAGKAAVPMALGLVDALGHRLRGGIVVCKEGHDAEADHLPPTVEVRTAAHPVPDSRSLAAAEGFLRLAAAAQGERLLAAISGGASALVSAPAWGISLADKVRTTAAVARAGASIHELNTVRKHLSRIKGGCLAAAAKAPITAFVLSDVVDNDLATVGGGPVVADPTRFGDALAVLDRQAVVAPPPVRAALEAGARGLLPETPKRLDGVDLRLVAGPDDLVAAADQALSDLGISSAEVERRYCGTVEALAAAVVRKVLELADAARAEPRAVLVGGEPTLSLPGRTGRGGRAQHLALLIAQALAQAPDRADRVAVLCVASDGTDGPTADAGGLVDAGTWKRAAAAGADPATALAAFDSGRALEAASDLVTTGPTGTNLCDLVLAIVAR